MEKDAIPWREDLWELRKLRKKRPLLEKKIEREKMFFKRCNKTIDNKAEKVYYTSCKK